MFIIQYSPQLADTVGAKKLSANWRCPPFGKFFNISLNFENKAFFYIYKVQTLSFQQNIKINKYQKQ